MGVKIFGEEAKRLTLQREWQRRATIARSAQNDAEKAAVSARLAYQALMEVAPKCPHWVEYWTTGRHGSEKGDLFYRCTVCGETFREPDQEFLNAREIEK